MPFTTAIIGKGAIIERGRINKNGETFYSEFDISYRTDTGNIKKFGRANQPFHSRFYGAMPSAEIKMPTIGIIDKIQAISNKICSSGQNSGCIFYRYLLRNT